MIVTQVQLRNIRSYQDETIEFPEGTVLLSGDIGSGKTSILLAVEFALFGIRRGTLTGSDLLRHGCREGSVELTVAIDDRDITIHRALKRESDRVAQQPGYLVIDGKKFEGTPVELKSKVIDLLGYPKELVSKSKSLIYRYTVYTPQEQMKEIIYDDPDDRLDTLRKVFNIDKYKRVKENAALLRRELKSERDMHATRAEGLDNLKDTLSDKRDRLDDLSEQREALQDDIDEQQVRVKELRERLEELEERAEDVRERQKKLESVRSTLDAKRNRLDTVAGKVEELEEDIAQREDEETLSLDDVNRKIEAAEDELDEYDATLSQIQEKVVKREQQRDDARETKQQIADLDKCPLCKQDVTDAHVEEVRERQNETIQEAKEKLDKAATMRDAVEQKKETAETKLDKLRDLKTAAERQRERDKRYEEKQERVDDLREEQEELQGVIDELEEREETLAEFDADVLDKLDIVNEEYETATEELQEFEVELAEVKQARDDLRDSIEELEERQTDMQDAEERAEEIAEKLDWLQESFIPTIEVVERHVMLRIYDQFNEYFTEWFNLLIDDDTLQVRLDKEFTPELVQDGYETSIENLSGGERTSLALAYRLSLTKVINNLLSSIKTKDWLILDEPTDGFSSDQLDTVRDVLEALDIRQVIVVSHEEKLESFVDSVLHVVKRNNVSRVE